MKPKKEDLIEKTQQWIEIAEEDFRFAKFGLTIVLGCKFLFFM
ncbi:MAG: hypothetical protein WC557_01180 [Ignavibacteriaceae bacterium]